MYLFEVPRHGAGRWVNAFFSAAEDETLLDNKSWNRRHSLLLGLVALQPSLLMAAAFDRGYDGIHALLEASPIAFAGLMGWVRKRQRLEASGWVAIALYFSSAVLVHLLSAAPAAWLHLAGLTLLLSLYRSWAAPAICLLTLGILIVAARLEPHAVLGHDGSAAKFAVLLLAEGLLLAATTLLWVRRCLRAGPDSDSQV